MAVVVLVGAVSAEAEIIHKVFVTSIPTSLDSNESFPPPYPSWGGLAAADWVVTYEGWLGGYTITDDPGGWDGVTTLFRAILSTSDDNGANPDALAINRLPISGRIVDMVDRTVAVSAADLWDGDLLTGISYDGYGDLVPENSNVWTGTKSDGTHAGNSAGYWNDANLSGMVGRTGQASQTWIQSHTVPATESARLYGLSPPIDTETGEFLDWGYQAPVPEPSTFVTFAGLFGMGLLGYWRRRASSGSVGRHRS